MPCRWHCERQKQDGGIHRHAAGNALHSLVSSLPTGFSCPIVSSRTAIEFFVSRLPKLFARLRSIEPQAPSQHQQGAFLIPSVPPRGRRPWTWPAANGGLFFGWGVRPFEPSAAALALRASLPQGTHPLNLALPLPAAGPFCPGPAIALIWEPHSGRGPRWHKMLLCTRVFIASRHCDHIDGPARFETALNADTTEVAR
jgi:hypothetical protein